MRIIIAALAKNYVIGAGDRMPWSIPEEFNQFLRFIEGQTVIMGRRSWGIFRKRLTSQHNVVVSRSASELEGATVCSSTEEALETAQSFGKTVFIAGGATIYEQTLDLADKMYLSYIKGEYEGDTYFPEFDESRWEVEERTDHPRFEFVIYARK